MGRSNYGLLLALANGRGEWRLLFLWRVAEARQGARLYCTLAAKLGGWLPFSYYRLSNSYPRQMQTEKPHGCVLAIIRLKMA